MLNIHSIAFVISAASLACASPTFPQERTKIAVERPLQISQVPPKVLSAAEGALGAQPTEAKIKMVKGKAVYEITGTNMYFKTVSVDVTGDGTVVRGVNPWDADND